MPFDDDEPRSHGSPLVALFILLIPLSYSQRFVEAGFGIEAAPAWWALLIVDSGLLAIAVLSARGIRSGSHRPWWNKQAKAWWAVGCAVLLILDVISTAVARMPLLHHIRDNVPVSLVITVSFLITLVILMAAAAGASPLIFFGRARRRRDIDAWSRLLAAAPLLAGVVGGYAAAAIWDASLVSDRRTHDGVSCYGVIGQEYFAQISQIIPLLLVAVGLEAGLFRRMLSEPVQRAMTTLTVVVLCAGEILALTTLPWSNSRCGDILVPWHEFLAYTLSMAACCLGLASLVWAIVMRSSSRSSSRPSQPNE